MLGTMNSTGHAQRRYAFRKRRAQRTSAGDRSHQLTNTIGAPFRRCNSRKVSANRASNRRFSATRAGLITAGRPRALCFRSPQKKNGTKVVGSSPLEPGTRNAPHRSLREDGHIYGGRCRFFVGRNQVRTTLLDHHKRSACAAVLGA